jgi:hypothetical protein
MAMSGPHFQVVLDVGFGLALVQVGEHGLGYLAPGGLARLESLPDSGDVGTGLFVRAETDVVARPEAVFVFELRDVPATVEGLALAVELALLVTGCGLDVLLDQAAKLGKLAVLLGQLAAQPADLSDRPVHRALPWP